MFLLSYENMFLLNFILVFHDFFISWFIFSYFLSIIYLIMVSSAIYIFFYYTNFSYFLFSVIFTTVPSMMIPHLSLYVFPFNFLLLSTIYSECILSFSEPPLPLILLPVYDSSNLYISPFLLTSLWRTPLFFSNPALICTPLLSSSLFYSLLFSLLLSPLLSSSSCGRSVCFLCTLHVQTVQT